MNMEEARQLLRNFMHRDPDNNADTDAAITWEIQARIMGPGINTAVARDLTPEQENHWAQRSNRLAEPHQHLYTFPEDVAPFKSVGK